MLEPKVKPLLHPKAFIRRLLTYFIVATGVMGFSLGLGVIGYHHFANLPWVDSLLNASMILGGMGQIDTLNNNEAKLFASFYALFSGLVLITSVGIFFAPVIHRIFHRFHLDS